MNSIFIADGGGTKTYGWLSSPAGEVQRELIAGPSNVARLGRDGLDKVVREFLSTDHSISQATEVLFGLAGVGRETERALAESVLREYWPNASLHVVTDAHLAYAGAFARGERGILLIVGTGSIAFYQNPHGHEFFRAGGWGPLLGDEGGGAWMGREALRLCLREAECAELSPFHAAVLDKLGISSTSEIIAKVYRENFGPTSWAELAPLIFDFAAEQKNVQEILQSAAMELVALLESLLENMPQKTESLPLVVHGGLWERRDLLEPLLTEEIRLRNLPLYITEPDGGPIEGALTILKSHR